MSITRMTQTDAARTSADAEAEALEHKAIAFEYEAKASILLAEARRRRAVEEHQQRNVRATVAAPAHMTRSEYAQRSRVSNASVSRWVKEGMPTMPVGTTDRIDPVAADLWRRTRPRTATTPKKATAKDDDVDVSAPMAAAGIRRVRGTT